MWWRAALAGLLALILGCSVALARTPSHGGVKVTEALDMHRDRHRARAVYAARARHSAKAAERLSL
jgi:hypothetical protein